MRFTNFFAIMGVAVASSVEDFGETISKVIANRGVHPRYSGGSALIEGKSKVRPVYSAEMDDVIADLSTQNQIREVEEIVHEAERMEQAVHHGFLRRNGPLFVGLTAVMAAAAANYMYHHMHEYI